MSFTKRTIWTQLALLAAVVTPMTANTTASADVVEADWNGWSNFQYWIYHMPDFDQKREVLPGNGSMYCVPTSATNLMGYIGNHGFPAVDPGSGNWQAPGNYDWISTNIAYMGLNMGTSATGGTGGTGHINGVNSWLAAAGVSDKLVANRYYANGNWAPKIQNFGCAAIHGALVNFCYGRYDVTGYSNGTPIIDRTGGHCVTLSRIDVNPVTDPLMWIRNPSTDDGDLDAQGIFANTAVDPQPRWAIRDGNLRLYTELDVPNSAKLRLIDSYLSIKARQGYSFDDTGVGGGVGVNTPFGGFTNTPQEVPFDLPQGMNVLGMEPMNEGLGYAVLGQDPQTGIAVVIFLLTAGPTAEPTDQVEVPGARSMVLGDDRLLYILGRNFGPSGDVDYIECRDPDNGFALRGRVDLPWLCHELVYDDAADMVCALPEPGGPPELVCYTKGLESGPTLQPLPGGAIPQDAYKAVCTSDGTIYMISPDGQIICISIDRTSSKSFQFNILDVESADADERGHLFLAANGALTELAPDENGDLQRVPDSAWTGLKVGKHFSIDRSRTNFDPRDEEMIKLDDNTVPNDSEEDGAWSAFVDCLADVNADLHVDVADLLSLLAKWGSDDAVHDFAPAGGDGTVNVSELLQLLADWGVCPQ